MALPETHAVGQQFLENVFLKLCDSFCQNGVIDAIG
tara:strand:- start:9473 stop:9580 length:108 start_codon:yes stop_codon:yes gene_type:complete